jgi:hypothetical protein
MDPQIKNTNTCCIFFALNSTDIRWPHFTRSCHCHHHVQSNKRRATVRLDSYLLCPSSWWSFPKMNKEHPHVIDIAMAFVNETAGEVGNYQSSGYRSQTRLCSSYWRRQWRCCRSTETMDNTNFPPLLASELELMSSVVRIWLWMLVFSYSQVAYVHEVHGLGPGKRIPRQKVAVLQKQIANHSGRAVLDALAPMDSILTLRRFHFGPWMINSWVVLLCPLSYGWFGKS